MPVSGFHVKRNDEVLVIAGRERGKRGKIRRVLPEKQRVVVEGVNLVKRHLKARQPGARAGIVEQEAALHVSNLMLICAKCGEAGRFGRSFLEDGRKVRRCKKCGEVVD